jgi:hypothetical protein
LAADALFASGCNDGLNGAPLQHHIGVSIRGLVGMKRKLSEDLKAFYWHIFKKDT